MRPGGEMPKTDENEKNPTDTEEPSDKEKVEDDPKDDESDPDNKGDAEDPEDGSEDDESSEDELPDWARERISKANAEAANYRVKLRTAERALEEASDYDELKKAVEELKQANVGLEEANAALQHQALVSSVARQYKLPDDLAEVLKGNTEEELKAHAEKLRKYAPEDGDDPTPRTGLSGLRGGLDPSDDDEFDPVAIVKKHKSRNRS